MPDVADLKDVPTGLAGLEREASNLIRVACGSYARGALIGGIAQDHDLSVDNGGSACAIHYRADDLPWRQVRRQSRYEARRQMWQRLMASGRRAHTIKTKPKPARVPVTQF